MMSILPWQALHNASSDNLLDLEKVLSDLQPMHLSKPCQSCKFHDSLPLLAQIVSLRSCWHGIHAANKVVVAADDTWQSSENGQMEVPKL